MNREIKFRAWDGDQIWYDYLIARPQACNTLAVLWEEEFAIERYGLKEWKIMQFTGLKDKNGKEIYEGDICRYNTWLTDHEDEWRVADVVWDNDGCWLFRGNQFTAGIYSRIEVIGNIW